MTRRQIGPWIVLEMLGEGGQARVYRVRRDGDESEYALKELKPWQANGPGRSEEKQRTRFRLEVSAVKDLADAGCPNIIHVIDTDLDPVGGGQPWFVMPLYRAGPLWKARREPQYLEDYTGNSDRSLEVVGQIAKALAFMHEAGPVYAHRDVKSNNIFFDVVRGSPILGDFGIVHTPESEQQNLTDGHEHLGPARWRPPEFRIGGAGGNHPKSDVYLLGGLLYEMLSGGWSIDETEQADGRFTHELPDFALSRFTDDPRLQFVNQLLRNMLRRDPDLRISAGHVVELCESIRAWRDGTPTIEVNADVNEAEIAAAEYRARSRQIREDRLRQELHIVCDRVIAHFGFKSWAPKNELTRMFEVNWGDAPLGIAQEKFPEIVWMAVRVTVAFETTRERPMFMSYVFIGRRGGEEEIVALYTEDKAWTVLSRGPVGNPEHEMLMIETARREQDRLTGKIVPEIRRLIG